MNRLGVAMSNKEVFRGLKGYLLRVNTLPGSQHLPSSVGLSRYRKCSQSVCSSPPSSKLILLNVRGPQKPPVHCLALVQDSKVHSVVWLRSPGAWSKPANTPIYKRPGAKMVRKVCPHPTEQSGGGCQEESVYHS